MTNKIFSTNYLKPNTYDEVIKVKNFIVHICIVPSEKIFQEFKKKYYNEKSSKDPDLSDNELLSFLNNSLQKMLLIIKNTIINNSYIIKNDTYLEFHIFNQPDYFGAYHNTISDKHKKYFSLSFTHFFNSYEEDNFKEFKLTIIHEITHAFDEKIDRDVKQIDSEITKYKEEKKQLYEDNAILAYVHFLRAEGKAMITEHNNLINKNTLKGFFSQPFIFKYYLLEFENIINNLYYKQNFTVENLQLGTIISEFHRIYYPIGTWTFYLIQNYILKQNNRLTKYYIINNQQIDLLERYFYENSIDFEKLFDINYMAQIFIILNIKPIFTENIREYLIEDFDLSLDIFNGNTKYTEKNFKYWILKTSPEDLIFLENKKIFNLESIEIINKYEEARKSFKISEKYALMYNNQMYRINKKLRNI